MPNFTQLDERDPFTEQKCNFLIYLDIFNVQRLTTCIHYGFDKNLKFFHRLF